MRSVARDDIVRAALLAGLSMGPSVLGPNATESVAIDIMKGEAPEAWLEHNARRIPKTFGTPGFLDLLDASNPKDAYDNTREVIDIGLQDWAHEVSFPRARG